MLMGVDRVHEIDYETLSSMDVEDMWDGGMGGIRFVSDRTARLLGRDLATETFVDADGVDVIATLSLDNYGDLFELDLWKVDFSPIVRLSPKGSSTAN